MASATCSSGKRVPVGQGGRGQKGQQRLAGRAGGRLAHARYAGGKREWPGRWAAGGAAAPTAVGRDHAILQQPHHLLQHLRAPVAHCTRAQQARVGSGRRGQLGSSKCCGELAAAALLQAHPPLCRNWFSLQGAADAGRPRCQCEHGRLPAPAALAHRLQQAPACLRRAARPLTRIPSGRCLGRANRGFARAQRRRPAWRHRSKLSRRQRWPAGGGPKGATLGKRGKRAAAWAHLCAGGMGLAVCS